MKISNSNNGSVDTNNSNQTSYDFNIGDVSTIIDILRNRLYSNPIQTLTQEYLSNARDSHREAGKAEVPIRVTLPTKLDSSLKIRDFGVGLSKDRVRDVFVSYGISTKRKDNVQTGGFGLGAKSAWAYTDSFVVVSYFNGVCSTYIAHTGKSSNGTFELINECGTNEPNGVEVQIPVKEHDISKFVNSVYRTTMFWDTKPDLLGITDLELPNDYVFPQVSYQSKNVKIVVDNSFNKNIFDTGHYNLKAFVLIDKIPYNISKFIYQVENLRSLLNVIHKDHIVFIEVENGSVEVAASREEVSSDSSNLAKINEVCNKASETVFEIVKNEFNRNFSSIQDYANVYTSIKDTFHCHYVPKEHLKLEYNFEDVKFELRGLVDNFHCDKFNSIVDCHFEEQENRTIIRLGNTDLIRVNENTKIVIKDVDYSNILVKRKAKKLLDEGAEHVYFISCSAEHYSKLQKCANALLISNLKHDAISVSGKKRLKGMVGYRPLVVDRRSRRSDVVISLGRKEIELEKMSQEGKYVIVPFGDSDKYDYENHHFVNMVNYLNKNGMSVIKCSKKDYEEISELDNVFDYGDVVKNIEEYVTITNESIEGTVFSKINRNLYQLRRFSKDILCPKVQKLIGLYPDKMENPAKCPESILKLYKHYMVAEKKANEISDLENEISLMYPLITGSYHSYGVNLHQEYVYYINNKHQTVFSKNYN